MVRAKFKVQSIEKTGEGDSSGATITLWPVVSGSEENEQFFKYTPAGSIVLSTINPGAAEQFEVGGEYYVDFLQA